MLTTEDRQWLLDWFAGERAKGLKSVTLIHAPHLFTLPEEAQKNIPPGAILAEGFLESKRSVISPENLDEFSDEEIEEFIRILRASDVEDPDLF